LGDAGGIEDPGGIEAWIRLGEAVGLTRDDVTSLRFVVPAARFAVDAYANFARQRPWQEAIASSLTELFAPHIHQQRIDTWPDQYPWVDPAGLQYFRNRLDAGAARRRARAALHARLLQPQPRIAGTRLEILQFKLDVLWRIADAIMLKPVRDRDPRREAAAAAGARS